MATLFDNITVKKVKREDQKLLWLLDEYKLKGSTTGKAIIDDCQTEVRFVVITPALAEALLERNTSNRGVKEANLLMIKKEVEAGNWVFNGDPIRFSFLGILNDGQHRLLTIIETGVSMTCTVITGLSPEAFKSIDIGAKRSGGDILSIEGVANASSAAATTKFVYGFKNNLYSINRNSVRTLTNTEIYDYYLELPTLQESLTLGMRLLKRSENLMTLTNVSGFHYLFSEVDEELATEFITKLILGTGLEMDSPITHLRNKLIRAKTDQTFNLTQLNLVQQMVYVWDKFREGKKIKVLRIPDDYGIEIN